MFNSAFKSAVVGMLTFLAGVMAGIIIYAIADYRSEQIHPRVINTKPFAPMKN
jgi:hypothetical protein